MPFALGEIKPWLYMLTRIAWLVPTTEWRIKHKEMTERVSTGLYHNPHEWFQIRTTSFACARPAVLLAQSLLWCARSAREIIVWFYPSYPRTRNEITLLTGSLIRTKYSQFVYIWYEACASFDSSDVNINCARRKPQNSIVLWHHQWLDELR